MRSSAWDLERSCGATASRDSPLVTKMRAYPVPYRAVMPQVKKKILAYRYRYGVQLWQLPAKPRDFVPENTVIAIADVIEPLRDGPRGC
ncbi:hypothetical protein Tco_0275882 [Tanacetum coccineum]